MLPLEMANYVIQQYTVADMFTDFHKMSLSDKLTPEIINNYAHKLNWTLLLENRCIDVPIPLIVAHRDVIDRENWHRLVQVEKIRHAHHQSSKLRGRLRSVYWNDTARAVLLANVPDKYKKGILAELREDLAFAVVRIAQWKESIVLQQREIITLEQKGKEAQKQIDTFLQ